MSDRGLRAAAIGCFGLTVALALAALPLAASLEGLPRLAEGFRGVDVGDAIFTASVAAAGLLIGWYRPRNSVGWWLAASAFLEALCSVGQAYGTRAMVVPEQHLPLGQWVLSFTAPLWVHGVLIPATIVLLRYPTGQIAGRWARRVDLGVRIGLVLLWASYAGGDQSVSDEVLGGQAPINPPTWVLVSFIIPAAVLLIGGLVFSIVHTIVRTVRATAPERQQLLLLLVIAPTSFVLLLSPYEWTQKLLWGIPFAVVLGVVRYNLLGIEIVVRRTLLYGGLTAMTLVVFVAVTAALASVIPHGPAPQVVAASLVAVGLVPVRDRLQRGVDRFVYGERGDPLAALARLSVPMGKVADDELLMAVATAVRDALRVQGVVIAGGDGQRVTVGEASADAPVLDLRVGDAVVGGLQVSPRRGERTLTSSDLRLLDALAPMIAVVVQSVQLSAELRREQQRSTEATQAERARLRRDLHDGLGPSLTGIGLGLEAVQSAAGEAIPARTQEMLARLRAETSTALEEVRRIIDDLRPRSLELGSLLDSIRATAAHITASTPVRVEVEVDGELDCLNPAVEAATLRIVDEALTNVVRHARATQCHIGLSCTDAGLDISVVDNGVGFAGPRDGGVGVPSMRARAESLGGRLDIARETGGTRLSARIPIGSPA